MQIRNGIIYHTDLNQNTQGFTSVTASRSSDGKILWTQHFEQIEAMEIGDHQLYITNFIYAGDQSKTFFHALDIDTGKLLWKDQIAYPYGHAVLSNGSIYLPDGWNIQAIRAKDGTIIWTQKTPNTTFQFSRLVFTAIPFL